MSSFIPSNGFVSTKSILPTNAGEQHIACVLLVDTSGSMAAQGKIDELNNALAEFGKVLLSDEHASGCADVAVVSFESKVNIEVPFCPASEYTAPKLAAGGCTAMNEAIITGLDLLEQRKQTYRQYGIPYYRPWMFLLTDGEPTDDRYSQETIKRLHDAITNKKVNFFPMGIGEDANIKRLRSYNMDGLVLKADSANFKEAFVWLSNSMAVVMNDTKNQESGSTTMPPLPQGVTIGL